MALWGVLGVAGTVASGQVLARPGWAGSGITATPWWHGAVLYRVVPERFQDSNGDGVGDLGGVAERMGYLQTLGVDAVVLEGVQPNEEGFDEVLTAAAGRHIRVLVVVKQPAGATAASDSDLLARSRLWLTRGAAGILLESGESAASAAPLLARLRALTGSFPGGRVLLAETAGGVGSVVADPPGGGRRPGKGAAGAQLTAVPLEETNATAKTIRLALSAVNDALGAGPSSGVFLSEEMDAEHEKAAAAEAVRVLDGRRRAFALVLLATRGGASLMAGQEIGQLPVADAATLMQWTPTNVTAVKKAAEPVAVKVAAEPRDSAPATEAAAGKDGYGPYRPYVPPPKVVKPMSGGVTVVDPNQEKGFTTGVLKVAAPADAAAMNVAVEELDEGSLLHLYERLIALHRDSPTLREGAELLLNYDDLDAVVWVRTPPRGVTTSATMIGVCNLSGAPLHLSLNEELQHAHVHTGSIRNLLSVESSQTSVQSTGDLTLPAYGVFLGELYH